MIEMYNDDNILPSVNLIFTNLTPLEIITRFDFSYC